MLHTAAASGCSVINARLFVMACNVQQLKPMTACLVCCRWQDGIGRNNCYNNTELIDKFLQVRVSPWLKGVGLHTPYPLPSWA